MTPQPFTIAGLAGLAGLAALSTGCASITPAPYAEKEADALYAPGDRDAGEDTGGEDPGPQAPDTIVGQLRYGERSEDLDCSFVFDVRGDADPSATCPYCDLRWGYEVSYTDATEPFSDSCARLSTISPYVGRYDYLTSLFQSYAPSWVFGDRSAAPYLALGVQPDDGYYDYGGYSYYSYFRTFIGTYDVSFDESSGVVDWEVTFGVYSYYYGYYDYGAGSVTFIGGTATAR